MLYPASPLFATVEYSTAMARLVTTPGTTVAGPIRQQSREHSKSRPHKLGMLSGSLKSRFRQTLAAGLASFLLLLCGNVLAIDLNALQDGANLKPALDDDSNATELRDRMIQLEDSHALEIERLERRINELEEVIRRIELLSKMQNSDGHGNGYATRGVENWSRVNDGMHRRDVYRLLGRGIKDTKSIASDCRCYTRGRICFDDNGQSTKTDARCRL